MRAALVLLIMVAGLATALGACTDPTAPAEEGEELDAFAFATARPQDVGMSPAVLAMAVDSLDAWAENDRMVGAVVLLIRHGQVVLHHAVGWMDRDRQIPMRTDHIMRMRSMTKPLVGTAILMLKEEGRLHPDDRVCEYIASFCSNGWEEVTLMHLLTHTSGVSGGIYVTSSATREEGANRRAAVGPGYEPGSQVRYSDGNAHLLNYIVEIVTGEDPKAFVRRRIFEPLRMEDAFNWDLPATHQHLRPRIASTYRGEPGDWTRWWENGTGDIRLGANFFTGGAGNYATAMDYARFLAMWTYGGALGDTRLLEEETVAFGLYPHSHFVYAESHRDSRNTFRGLQWFVHSDEFGPYTGSRSPGYFSHSGFDGTLGFGDRRHGLVGVILTQSRGSLIGTPLLNLFYRAIMD